MGKLFCILAFLLLFCGFSDNCYAYLNNYDILVDGDLFLDYSVFSENEDLYITGDIFLTAETVTIYSYDQEPFVPDLATLSIIVNPINALDETGNILLFSDIPITIGSFEATGNLYIGNYSSLNPVPIQSSIFSLASGLIGLIGFRITKETKSPNRVAGGFSPPAPTTPSMRVRTGRFTKPTGR